MSGCTAGVPESVLSWAARRGPAAVLAAARARLEAGQRGPRLTLAAVLDDAARREVSELLGLEWRAGQDPVTLGQLRTALRRHDVDLEDLLVACGGPVGDARAERAAARAERADEVESARATLLDAGVPPAAVQQALARRWLGQAGHSGQVRGTAEQLARMWSALPPPAGTLLATFAGDRFGDPHALDKDQLLGRAAARLIAAAHHASSGRNVDGAVGVLEPEGWRAAWASGGVTCDRVSSTVLVLNLPLSSIGATLDETHANTDPPAVTLQRLCSAAIGEPVWLTARLLPVGFQLPAGSCTGVIVRVCENPAVVEAAADEFGAAAPPLVCTYGRPSLASRALLTALAAAGADVLVTADRDDAGRGILAGLLNEVPGALEWLSEAEGVYEENRLRALLSDLRGT